jgi:DNA cross-link repair 1C protein
MVGRAKCANFLDILSSTYILCSFMFNLFDVFGVFLTIYNLILEMSCFPGKLREFGYVSLDQFADDNLLSTVYFLTHCHSDHMVGLDSPMLQTRFENNNFIKLYCNPVTSALLLAFDKFAHLRDHIESLPTDEETTVSVFTADGSVSYSMLVTLIPAGHCPGSVMFLLKGNGLTVLYTGDFRLAVGDTPRLRYVPFSHIV